jgi:hypothetical protein
VRRAPVFQGFVLDNGGSPTTVSGWRVGEMWCTVVGVILGSGSTVSIAVMVFDIRSCRSWESYRMTALGGLVTEKWESRGGMHCLDMSVCLHITVIYLHYISI